MKYKILINTCAAICKLFFIYIISTTQSFSETGKYPWSVNLDLDHSEQDGYKADIKFQQGISWDLPNTELKFIPFVEAEIIQSSKRDDYWNNVFEPAIGLKLRYEGQGSLNSKVKWKEVDFGVRHTKYEYTGSKVDSDQESDRTEVFLNVYVSGQWL